MGAFLLVPCLCAYAILHFVQYDRYSALIRVLKGGRGKSPLINRADCGEQVDFQGAAGGKILAKIAKKFFQRVNEVSKV